MLCTSLDTAEWILIEKPFAHGDREEDVQALQVLGRIIWLHPWQCFEGIPIGDRVGAGYTLLTGDVGRPVRKNGARRRAFAPPRKRARGALNFFPQTRSSGVR